MTGQAQSVSKEVESFEAYTIYALRQSASALLGMMDRSKRIASAWPDVMALAQSAGLCKEVAGLACFQNSLAESLGDVEGVAGERFDLARTGLQGVMESLEDSLNFNDPDIARLLFSTQLPNALNNFALAIPPLEEYIRRVYLGTADPGEVAARHEDA